MCQGGYLEQCQHCGFREPPKEFIGTIIYHPAIISDGNCITAKEIINEYKKDEYP